MKKLIFFLAVILGTLGCTKSPPISVSGKKSSPDIRKNEVDGSQVKTFSIDQFKNLRMPSLTLFLWNENVSVEELTGALRNSKGLDERETDSLNFTPKGELVLQLESDLSSLGEALAALEKELADLEANPDSDPAQIEVLKIKIQEKKAEILKKTAEIDEVMVFLKPYLQKYQVPLVLATNSDIVSALMEKVMLEIADRISNIQKVSTWFDMDSQAVVFNTRKVLDSNGVSRVEMTVDFYGVKFPGSNETKFSTAAGTISGVKYEEKGAAMEFVVKVSPTDLYFFEIHRIAYEDRTGRIIFKGDIIYKQLDASGNVIKIRRGQAKLSDSAN